MSSVVRRAFSVDGDYLPAGRDDHGDENHHPDGIFRDRNVIDGDNVVGMDHHHHHHDDDMNHHHDDDDVEYDYLHPGRHGPPLFDCFTHDTARVLRWITLGVLGVSLVAAVWVFLPRGTNGPSSPQANQLRDAPADETDICQDPIYHRLKTTSTIENLANGAVASDHALCSQMGLTVLRDLGGNAVDAAVTTALCLGVANPGSSGLGGGAFLLIHAPVRTDFPTLAATQSILFDDHRDNNTTAIGDNNGGNAAAATKVTHVIDCREVAPGAATTTMFESNPQASVVGGLAVGVPGELRGLELAHAMHGRLPWNQLVEPVSHLATKGVEVNANLAHEIALMTRLYTDPKVADTAVDYGLRDLLTRGDNWDNPLRELQLLQNQKLGELLQAVADKGADALYVDMAESLAADIQAAGGIVSSDDIQSYRPTLRSPVSARNVRGFSLVGVPPPSSGGAAVIGAARFLAGYDISLAAFADTLSAHLVSEALKHVFAIRMSLSDPAYHTETVQAAVRDLVRGSYVDGLRNATRDNSTLPLSHYGGSKWAQLSDIDGSANVSDAQEGDRRRHHRRLLHPFGYLNDAGTSHFSIVDDDGNAVAMTTSVNTYFGSTVVSKSTGIVLGNTMDDFASPGASNYFGVRPSEANYIQPGKKPLSSMSPTMVFRSTDDAAAATGGTTQSDNWGDLALVIGASGGPKIITAVVQVFILSLVFGRSLFEAVVHPRIHDQLIYHGAAATTIENAVLQDGSPIEVSQRTKDALVRRNHPLLNVDYAGTVQAIAIDLETKLMTATSDVRKGGSPAGY